MLVTWSESGVGSVKKGFSNRFKGKMQKHIDLSRLLQIIAHDYQYKNNLQSLFSNTT